MENDRIHPQDENRAWMDPHADIRGMPIGEVISRITNLNGGIRDFWSAAHGWAPADAADLLACARLDRQASLSACLSLWAEESGLQAQRDGELVLGWANLGALVEGTMKWFLSVYRENIQRTRTWSCEGESCSSPTR